MQEFKPNDLVMVVRYSEFDDSEYFKIGEIYTVEYIFIINKNSLVRLKESILAAFPYQLVKVVKKSKLTTIMYPNNELTECGEYYIIK